jgi:hypothetical protein
MKKVTAIVRATEITGDRQARKTAYDAALIDFIDNFTTLERLIRQDLGVEALA